MTCRADKRRKPKTAKISQLDETANTTANAQSKDSRPTASIYGKATAKCKAKVDSSDSSEDEEWPCIICGEPFANSKSREKWIQYQDCNKWAHEACTEGSRYFLCPNCDSEYD